MKKYLYLIFLILFTACEEKAKPSVIVNSDLKRPISCMKLDKVVDDQSIDDKVLLNHLEKLYAFDDNCSLILTLSSKKDIVCNSTNNMMSKNMGKFPKSFVKLELRKGMRVEYSYYVDLYSNVDEEDVEEGFRKLKKDLLNF